VHSIIDAISQVLLLWGLYQSQREPDDKRPFGYGRELYFWSFIVSLMIFTVGGCISVYEGLQRLNKPYVDGNGLWNYVVLGIAFIFTAASAFFSLKAFNKQHRGLSFREAIKEGKDPSVFIVLLGDAGDIIGLPVAFLGIFLSRLFHNVYYDGIASMVIGAVLIIISILLLRESRSLLMGEAPAKKTLLKIIAIAETDEAVKKIKQHFSIYLAPEEVVLQLAAIFKDTLTSQQITDAIGRITQNIQRKFPRVKQIFIEPAAE